jgi:hypothetical protein|tara:strand:+ start:975 stop:1430 length:456 start_codon:yes stop_codon:yes gene_type:complete
MLPVEQNKIKNSAEIISYVEKNNFRWVDRDLETKIGYSRFQTLYGDDMDQSLKDLIFQNLNKELKIINKFVQIQKYNPGDYILPHKDHVQLITKLHLFTLTTSKVDGLTCEYKDKFYKIPDIAGQYIDFPMFSWHWVNPVQDKRYSLVIGE